MSSQVYTIKIDIDESKVRDLEKRLMNTFNGGQKGASMKSAGAGGLGLNTTVKALGKLGLIAAGVTMMLTLVKKIADSLIEASPMLKQMVNLYKYSILLIIRPIGDFFGFFLRPIVTYFLVNIALPWMRLATPVMRSLGLYLGKSIAPNSAGIIAGGIAGGVAGGLGAWVGGEVAKFLPVILQNIQGHLLTFELGFKKWIDSLNLPTWDEMIKGITDWIDSLVLPTWDEMIKGITDWIDSLGLPTFDEMIKGITDWIDSLGLPTFDEMIKGITDWIDSLNLPTWDNMVQGITDWIDSLSLPSWDDITNIFNSLKSTLQSLAGSIGDFFKELAKWLGINVNGGGNTGGGNTGGGNTGNAQQGYQFPDLGDFQNQFSEWSNKLSDTLKGVP